MPLKRIGCDGTERSVPRGFSLLELIVVVAISITIVGFAVPIFSNFAQSLRTSGDSRSLAAMIAEAKLRAAANFTHARVYANLSGNTYRLEVWNKSGNSGAGCWQTDGDSNACTVATSPVTSLSHNVSFGYGNVGSAPTNTEPSLGQAPLCYTGYAGQSTNTTSVANTACIEFNSRGVPSDPAPGGSSGASGGVPDATGVLYVTDATAVYGVTVLASGEIQSWYSNNTSTPNWQQR
jgi:prepilin-type N-terminal cleavage/methylation domain-containing protein